MNQHTDIKTAIFPVAGFGTRMLPATKTMPKEMLPVVDRPLIHYVVQEAIQAGIERFVFVTGRNKEIIEDYFDYIPEQEAALEAKQKTEILEAIRDIPNPGEAVFIRQQKPLGLGHAVWCARHVVDGPFAVILPDVILKDHLFLKRMVDLYQARKHNILALYEVDPDKVSSYGIVGHHPSVTDEFDITEMVEKPSVDAAPSNMSVLGRYILSPEIMDLLEHAETGAGGEIQLTDAMETLLQRDGFSGLRYQNKMFDCGSREGFIEANLDIAYDQPALRGVIDRWIAENVDVTRIFQRKHAA